jgi:hypothetical protein
MGRHAVFIGQPEEGNKPRQDPLHSRCYRPINRMQRILAAAAGRYLPSSSGVHFRICCDLPNSALQRVGYSPSPKGTQTLERLLRKPGHNTNFPYFSNTYDPPHDVCSGWHTPCNMSAEPNQTLTNPTQPLGELNEIYFDHQRPVPRQRTQWQGNVGSMRRQQQRPLSRKYDIPID